MSNILAQELIRDVSEKIQPTQIFNLFIESNFPDSIALGTDLENLVEFAWSHYKNSCCQYNHLSYDKLTFIKQLSENKILSLYPNDGLPKYFIEIYPLENGIYKFP